MHKLKRQTNNYFRAWYHGKQFLGKTEAEAKAKRDAYKYECEHGIERPEAITVIDLAEKYLSTKVGIQANTYNQYASIMEKLTGMVGEKYVSAVTPADIKNVWKQFDGLSQSYIDKGKFLFKSFFQYAIDNRNCISNPTLSESSKPHKGTKGTHRCLTKTEVNLVLTVPHRCQTAAVIMLKAGLRRGEVLALEHSDIHDNRIYVSKAVKYVKNRPVIGQTKNESSERSVPLFGAILPFLSGSGLILPDEHGNLCSETAFNRAWESYMNELSAHLNGIQKRWYHRTKEWIQSHPDEYAYYNELLDQGRKAEAEEYRLSGWREVRFKPHDLRHTFVSTGRDKGVDIHTMMSWCGHSSERIILEIYDHLSESREQHAIEMMDD